MDNRLKWERRVSIFIFVLGLCAFLGADSFNDFYLDLKAHSSGEFIDYSKLTEFCGWTGKQFIGESDLQYGLRSAWNMLSAMLAVTVVAVIILGSTAGIIFAIFYYFGAFK